MTRTEAVSRLFATASIAAIIGAAAPALAQDAASQPPASEPRDLPANSVTPKAVEDTGSDQIVVTGSRIRRRDY